MQLENGQDSIRFEQVFNLVKRNLLFVVLITLISGLIAYLISPHIPKKYKSKTILSIQSSYFQHPLVSDLISEVQEPSEMSSQRLSLLRMALNDQFLDQLGQKYNLFKYPANHSLHSFERELLLNKIEYFSISPASFQISIMMSSPELAFKMTSEVLSQMKFTLTEQRYLVLLKARDSILKQAKLLKATLGDTPIAQQQDLEIQLSTMETNLAELRARFTENHPDVVQMRNRLKGLESRLRKKSVQAPTGIDENSSVFLSPASRVSTQEIFNDLLKKLSHLNIVLEMEKDRDTVSYLAVVEQPSIPSKPSFPGRLQIVLIGSALGVALSLLCVVFVELKQASIVPPEQLISKLGLELLGELPFLEVAAPSLLLEHSRKSALRIPHLAKES